MSERCPTCNQELPESDGDRSRRLIADENYIDKDLLFAQRKLAEAWPVHSCTACGRRGGCCQSHHHHVGDCCTHCGNDERRLDQSDTSD